MSDSVDDAIAALEDYIRRYPSGKFAELAQVRLDKLLAVRGERKAEPVSPPSNPFSHGTLRSDLDYRTGDRYEFRVIDGYTHLEQRRVTQVITALSQFEVTYDDGVVTDLLGNTLKVEEGALIVGQQMYPAEYTIGKKWTTRYDINPLVSSGPPAKLDFITMLGGPIMRGFGWRQEPHQSQVNMDFTVVAFEPIEVPAGRFSAFRVEGSGITRNGGKRLVKYWIAPDYVRRPLILDLQQHPDYGAHTTYGVQLADKVRWELAGYLEASRQGR